MVAARMSRKHGVRFTVTAHVPRTRDERASMWMRDSKTVTWIKAFNVNTSSCAVSFECMACREIEASPHAPERADCAEHVLFPRSATHSGRSRRTQNSLYEHTANRCVASERSRATPLLRGWGNTVEMVLFEISDSIKAYPTVVHAYTSTLRPVISFV